VQAGFPLAEAVLGAYVNVGRSILRAVVPLISGVLSGVAAAVLYAVFLRSGETGDFFPSAAQVDAGLLVALVVEAGVVRARLRPTWLQLQAQVGTLVLAAIGMASSLVGTVLTGSTIAIGAAFALSWGGTSAGVIGLFVLALGGSGSDSSGAPQSGD
jgi:hypothetical protein